MINAGEQFQWEPNLWGASFAPTGMCMQLIKIKPPRGDKRRLLHMPERDRWGPDGQQTSGGV
ncbi:hypothetical protein CRX69_20665 [Pseudomonas rhizophila]|uniref:Uncharacterized protein n=1 Tax=Pseudomonas rhizophila TaxID=2045200 RepID=A0ABN5JXA3_9PSED|nr:hypothetical protein CRX69_20665 [Pseudomonas rhizophila]MBD0701558.1 hypothetical protein [Pseudomonas sp. PSB1]